MIELAKLPQPERMEHPRPGLGQVEAITATPLMSQAPAPAPVPHGALSGGLSTVDCSDPGSVLGELICLPSSPWGWMSALSGWLSRMLTSWWPLLTVGAAMALLGGALLAVVIGRARVVTGDRSVWVEITPPAREPIDGASKLWRALAGLLSRTRPRSPQRRLVGVGWWVRWWVPRTLVVEFVATTAGTRVGVWVPPSIDADAVAAQVARCWPGARATLTKPPTLTGLHNQPAVPGLVGGVSAVHVAARGGAWAPLIDPGRAPRELRTDEVDPLHGVLETLAESRPGQTAVVQLIVTSHLNHRHRARNGQGYGQGQRSVSGLVMAGLGTVVIGLLRLAASLLFEIVDIMLPRGPRPSATTRPGEHPKTPPAPEDPVQAARRRDLAAKQARGPHLRATLRLAVTSTGGHGGYGGRVERDAVVGALLNCYDQAAPAAQLYPRPVRRAARAVAGRRSGPARAGLLLTVAEAAALWHLPADPSRYGIHDAPARVRRPRRDLPRLQLRQADPYNAHGRTEPIGQAGPAQYGPGHTAPAHRPPDDQWTGERWSDERWSDGGHDAAA